MVVASFLASHTTFEKYYEIIPKYRSNFSHLYFETIIFSEKSYFFFGAAFFFLFFASLSFSSFSKSGGGLYTALSSTATYRLNVGWKKGSAHLNIAKSFCLVFQICSESLIFNRPPSLQKHVHTHIVYQFSHLSKANLPDRPLLHLHLLYQPENEILKAKSLGFPSLGQDLNCFKDLKSE